MGAGGVEEEEEVEMRDDVGWKTGRKEDEEEAEEAREGAAW